MTQESHSIDDQQYVVENLKEIIQILTDLLKQKTMLKVSFNHGNDVYYTTIIEVDMKNHAVYLDIGRDDLFNSRLLTNHHVVFSKDGGIHIQWTSANLSAVMLKDGKALKIAIPHHLVRVQRREFYRHSVPITNPVICRIPLSDDFDAEVEKSLELVLFDASLGGIGVMAPDPLDPELVEGATFDSCKIDFPHVGMTSLTLCVANITSIQLRDGSFKHRIGLQYVNPSRGNQGLIQRYTFNLERDAMILAKPIN